MGATLDFVPRSARPRFRLSLSKAMSGAMSARLRKLIGLFGILGFLAAYVAGVTMVADHVPKHWAAQTAFYLVAGLAWGLPILPLISWMNRGR